MPPFKNAQLCAKNWLLSHFYTQTSQFIFFPFIMPQKPSGTRKPSKASAGCNSTLKTEHDTPPTARPRSVLGNALRNQETIESICCSWNCHTEPNMWALGAIPHLRCPPRLRQGGCSVACWSISQPIWRVAWWVRPHLLPPSSSNRPARMTPTSLHFQPDIPDWSDWWINNLQISDTGCFDLKIGIFFLPIFTPDVKNKVTPAKHQANVSNS